MWAAALAVPAAHFVIFDGLPLSSVPEVAFVTLVLVALVHPRSRERIRGVIATPKARAVAIGVGLLIVTVKFALFFGSPAGAFAACYTNPVKPHPGEGCERSYENLWAQDSVTRFDDTIDFGPRQPVSGDPTKLSGSNWNLSFVNDTRLNIYTEPGNLDVERLPFSAHWHGNVDLGTSGWVPVHYIGEGEVRIGDSRRNLPPSYHQERTIFVPAHAGAHTLSVGYRFADRARIGGSKPRGPYATLFVGKVQSNQTAQPQSPLRSEHPPLGWRGLGLVVDLAMLLVALGFAMAVAAALAPSRRFVALAALSVAFASVLARSRWGFGPVSLPIAPTVLALVALFVLLAWRRPADLFVLGAPVAIVVAFERVLARVPDLQYVLFRTRGSDWQTYQSFGRAIFESGSLEGGEKVFYYQPGMRYWAFGGHALFGDGDALPEVLGLALLLIAVLAATRWSVGRLNLAARLATPSFFLVVGAGAALILAFTSPSLVALIEQGASEYPTWIMIPLLLPLLFTRATLPKVLAGSALLGATTVFRPNQAVAAIALMAVFVVWTAKRDRRLAAGAVCLFVAVLLLPALHNVWYGGRIEILPTGANSVKDLPLDRLPDVFSDHGVRTLLRDKIAALTYLSPTLPRDDVLGMAILAIQGMWLMTVVRAVRRRSQIPWLAWCILGWPLAFALPSISFDVFIYYPRHIIAMYVAAAAAVMFVEARYVASADAPATTRRSPSSSVTVGS